MVHSEFESSIFRYQHLTVISAMGPKTQYSQISAQAAHMHETHDFTSETVELIIPWARETQTPPLNYNYSEGYYTIRFHTSDFNFLISI